MYICTHTHTYIYTRRALTSELHGSPDATTDRRKSLTEKRVACSPPSRRDKQLRLSTTPQRPPFNSPRGLSETHACPARQERAGPPVPGSPLQGKHAEVPSRPPHPRPARSPRRHCLRARAAPRPPRSLPPPAPPRHPGGEQTRRSPQTPAELPLSPSPSPERNRSEIPPPAPLWERKERGRGERENLYEWKRDRPQTFPRVFLEQPREGGVLKSLFCKEGKGSHRDRGAAPNPSLSCIFFFLRFANKSSPKAKKNSFPNSALVQLAN